MLNNKDTSEFYNWGNNCSGWHLVKGKNLSVIEEIIPPGEKEQIHYHKFSTQFFYILKSTATFLVDDKEFIVKEKNGIIIKPFSKHQIKNNSDKNLEFIVISQPTSKGDRVDEPFEANEEICLDGKIFKGIENSDNGEVSSETLFQYRQKENIVWATYEGGEILFGTLSGKITNNELTFTYQHQNLQGEFLTGKCKSTIKANENGKISLHEDWQWTCRDFSSGTSVLTEV